MSFLRMILIALTVCATSLSGAMATGHGDWQDKHGRDTVISADMMHMQSGHMQSGCCDDMAERSSGCHVLPAIEPGTPHAAPLHAQTRAISFAPPALMSGLSPSGLLDPPRRG